MILLSHIQLCPSVLTKDLNLSDEKRLNFYTDTRKFKYPGAFVAIPGAKVNVLDLISPLLDAGCELVVYQDSSENKKKIKDLLEKYPAVEFVAVTDSVDFLQEITHYHATDWQAQNPKHTLFAISGSNGKTTHKEMLSFILEKVFPGEVVATEKNNNNHLGVPLTLLNVNLLTKFVVLELGSNHPGEIKVLCDIAAPNAGLTTNIGATHLEFFGDEKAVFDEEGYLYQAVKDQTDGKGFYLINEDDSFLKTFASTKGSVRYGSSPKAQAKISYGNGSASLKYKGVTYKVSNKNITGKHNFLNLITTLFIASTFFPSKKKQFEKAASEFTPTKNRSQWIDVEKAKIYLDAYNANPSSMKAALEGFKDSLAQKKLGPEDSYVVLGDMNELGENGPSYHEDLGRFIKKLGFSHVCFVGRFASDYIKGYGQGAQSAPSSADFKSEYRGKILSQYSYHFVKGSRSLQLESLFDIT